MIKVNMTFNRETKGTVLYAEVDSTGNHTPQDFAKIGSLYIKKRSFNGGKFPNKITVEVNYEA